MNRIVFIFVYYFPIDLSIKTYWGLEDVKLAPQSTSPGDVAIQTVKKINYLEKSVTFSVSCLVSLFPNPYFLSNVVDIGYSRGLDLFKMCIYLRN